jgi:hypothetical protein
LLLRRSGSVVLGGIPETSMPRVELVTTSHEPDAELCELLVESVARHVAPSITHSIFVPRSDLDCFRHLVSPRTRIVAQEEVVSPSVSRSLTLNWKGGERKLRLLGLTPIRGWLFQQIVKLSVPSFIEADVLVIVDSDSAFCRSFDESLVVRDGRVRLYANPRHPPMHPHTKWQRNSARLLGLPARDWFGANYISNFIVWRRDVVLELRERISSVAGRRWESAVARTWHFSEDTAYGIFAQHVLADHRHFATEEDLAHGSSAYDVESQAGITHFCEGLQRHHVMVGIQSRGPLSLERQRKLYEWFDAAARDQDSRSAASAGRPPASNIMIPATLPLR